MAEVMTPPIEGRDENGDVTHTFTVNHTIADVARWIISEDAADEIVFMLTQEMKAANVD